MPPPLPRDTTRPDVAPILACAALPLVVLAMMLAAYRGVAPLWAGGSTDPSYGYLLNSLMAAELRVPVKTDHPGIPLELVGALVLRVWHVLTGSRLPLRDHVLTDPEPFLAAIVFVLLLVWAAASAFLGWATWRLTRSWPLMAVAQASPFLCFEVLRSGVQVMCEPLLLAGALALSGLILLGLLPETGNTSRLEAAMGLALGLGLATKIVFAPAAIPALVASRSGRGRVRVLLWAALAFGACLLFIAPRLRATAAWMWRLFASSGYHGQGAATVIDPERYTGGFTRLLVAELPLHAAFVAAIVICLWPRSPVTYPDAARRCALGLFAAWVATMAVAAKQPQTHYLVTVAGLAPALLVLAFWRLRLSERGRAVRLAQVALVLVLAGGVVHATRGALWLMRVRSNAKAGAELVARAAAGREREIVQGYRVSTIPAALASGDEWTDLVYAADLRRLYPDFLAFDCEGLHAFGQDPTPREVLARLQPDGAVLMRDAAWKRLDDCSWTGILPRKTIASRARDALYEARLLPPPPQAESGPWVGGMLVLTGMEPGSGPHRWASGRRTSLLFRQGDGPVTLEIAAGHALPGDQRFSVLANGVHLHTALLPRLPATDSVSIPLPARPGWNDIEFAYDFFVSVAPRTDTPVPGTRTRTAVTDSPRVYFETLRLR